MSCLDIKEFKKLSKTGNWKNNLIVEEGIYPSVAIRKVLEELYRERYYQHPSKIPGGGMGLCSLEHIKKGGLVGVYGGQRTWNIVKTRYGMELGDKDTGYFLIDSTPTGEYDYSLMGYINEYIWDIDKCNCKINPKGVITATKDIGCGDELFMSYGTQYDWSIQHKQILDSLPKWVRLAGETLGACMVEVEDRCKEIRSMTYKNMSTEVKDIVKGEGSSKAHRRNPGETGTAEWLQELLTCCNFYNQIAFRRQGEPGKVIDLGSLRNLRIDIPNTRKSGRTRNQKDLNEEELGTHEELLPPVVKKVKEGEKMVETRKKKIRRRERAEPKAEAKCESLPTGLTGKSSLRVLELNTNGWNDDKRHTVMNLILKHEIDVAILLDVRIVENEIIIEEKLAKERLGPGYKVMIVPVHPCGRKCHHSNRVGGQLWVFRHSMGFVELKEIVPEGALVKAKISIGGRKITIGGVYWPMQNDSPTSMWSRLNGEASENIRFGILQMANKGHEALIITGDFNSDTTKGDPNKIANLAEEIGCKLAESVGKTYGNGKREGQEGFRGSIIDHLIFGGKGIKVVNKVMEDLNISDHNPLISTFTLSTVADREVQKRRRMKLRQDVKLSENEMLIQIKQKYRELEIDDNLGPEEVVEQITSRSVSIVEEIKGYRRPRKYKLGWSPQYMAMKIALESVTLGRRLISTGVQISEVRLRVNERWDKRLAKLVAGNENNLRQVGGDCSRETWETKVSESTDVEILWQLRSLKKKMHGRARTEKRRQINENVKKREDERIKGKHRRVIKSILKQNRGYFLLEELQMAEELVVDQNKIHTAITDSFTEWFSGDNEAGEYEIGGKKGDWKDLLEEWEDFRVRYAHTNIPVGIMRTIWEGIQIKQGTQDLEWERKLLIVPSLKELSAAIKAAACDSAPGPSGLTFNMIKQWPDEIIMKVHSSLSELWESKTVPNLWKWKWLVPIPKVENPTLADLRPLSLIETLRKVWVSIIVRRIQDMWQATNVLEEGQHGFIRGKGTDTAALVLMEAMETAKEWRTQLYLSTWDMRHAFDTLSKQMQVYSWYRSGVPAELAEYLVGLDDQGQVVVRSPLAVHVNGTGGKEGRDRMKELAFIAERGTGQGDVTSPLAWDAAFDMLMTALGKIEEDRFYTSDGQSELIKVKDSAYADDLVSMMSRLEGLQQIADVVSGFCIIFGLELSISKFRAFAINWGNSKKGKTPIILIHKRGWVAQELELKCDGEFKHLGVLRDLHLSGENQWYLAKEQLQTLLGRVVGCKASAETKWMIIKTSIYEKVAYFGKFVAWSLEKYRELDRIVGRALKKITKNMQSYPTSLLYVDKRYMGLGFQRLSNLIQRRKMSLMQRILGDGGGNRGSESAARSLSGLLSRPHRVENGYLSAVIETVVTEVKHKEVWWASSMFQYMQEMGISITKSAAAISDPLEDINMIDWEHNRAISTPEKEEMRGRGVAIEGEKQAAMDGDKRLLVRVGQLWTSTSLMEKESVVVEIVGILEQDVSYIVWKSIGKVMIGSELRLEKSEFTCGAKGGGSTQHRRWADSEDMWLVQVTGDTHNADGSNSCWITQLWKQNSIVCMTAPRYNVLGTVPTEIQKMISALEGKTVKIYTDGSRKETASLGARMRGLAENTTIGSAIVAITEEGERMGIWIDCATHYDSAVYPETLGLAVAGLISRQVEVKGIYSDCQSAISTFHASVRLGRRSSPHWQLMESIKRTAYKDITKVKAHPERKGKNVKWTEEEQGNFWADMLAGGEVERFMEGGSNLVVSCEEVEALEWCTAGLEYVVKEKGLPLVRDIKVIEKEHEIRNYLERRDQYRQEAEVPRKRKWTGATTLLAGVMWRPKGIMERARMNRIVYDKYWTGSNKRKRGEEGKCELCGAGMEDQEHIIFRCTHNSMKARRTEEEHKLKRIISNLNAEDHQDSVIMTKMCKMSKEADGYGIFIGLLTPDMVEEIHVEFPAEVTTADFKKLAETLGCLSEYAAAMYEERGLILKRKAEGVDEPVERGKGKISEHFEIKKRKPNRKPKYTGVIRERKWKKGGKVKRWRERKRLNEEEELNREQMEMWFGKTEEIRQPRKGKWDEYKQEIVGEEDEEEGIG